MLVKPSVRAGLLACLLACSRGSATSIPAAAGGAPAPRACDHALLVSVDGLRSDALIALPPEALPGFTRLRSGASTLNARTDPDSTLTLPNHTAMLTGRHVLGGPGHAWTRNGEPAPGATLHANKGAYVAGLFDVAHDHGLATAMLVGKTKFALYDASWDAAHGAADALGADDGRDKLDLYRVEPDPAALTDALIELFADAGAGKRLVAFAHYAAPDLVAHANGWDVTPGSPYMQALVAVDRELGRLIDAIEASERLRGRTLVVLTADHGGGAPLRSHDQPHMWVDYVIPFLVWSGDALGPRDLYALNPGTRRDPGLARPRAEDAGPPPIRNGDAGNLVLAALGLPAVPGSTIGAAQDLRAR